MFLILSEYKDQSWKYYFVDKLFASYFSLFMTDEHILTFFVSFYGKKCIVNDDPVREDIHSRKKN